MTDAILTVSGLKKYYPVMVRGRGLYREKGFLKAVDDVSFVIRKGETLGLVGESGCGKSTLAKLAVKLLPVTGGQILYGDTDVTRFSARQMLPLRRRVQMIFQDPYSSLNPRETVRELVRAPLDAMNLGEPRRRTEQVLETLESVGLDASFMDKRPHEMSGGQRQRVAIARAIISEPDLLVCDEPVSALDVSVRGQILNLLKRLQRELGLSCLFISHDFGSVRYLCDRVAVMYLGRIVEQGEKRDIFERAAHPYTKALLSANPAPDFHPHGERVILRGDTAGAVYTISGCAFRTRCVYATEGCSKGQRLLEPLNRSDGGTHSSACPRYPRCPVPPFPAAATSAPSGTP